MDLQTDTLLLDLERGRTLRLHDAAGARLKVETGELWVTQEGDPRDLVLGPGDVHAIDRAGLSVLQALASARLSIAPSRGPAVVSSRPAIRRPRRWYVGASNAA
jgi:hypothetical protein